MGRSQSKIDMSGIINNKWMLPIILALMTLLTSALLMFSHELTADRIAAIKLENKLASLKKLLPDQLLDNDLINDAIEIEEPVLLGHRQAEQLYIGKKAGMITVMAVPVTARNGYSGDIDLLVGILANGEITAVEIITHKETPGLGDLIESRKSDWLQQFPGTSLLQPEENQWRVKKDQGHFDQITAATITPRAVVAAIKKALLYHKTWIQLHAQETE